MSGLHSFSETQLKTKIILLDELATLAGKIRRQNQKMVLTNGCFDLLHVGHVRYLEQARALGDCLVVALNSDESVRALKGKGRPLIPEADRAEVLAGLGAVDFVTIFAQERATRVIEAVQPAIYVKGGDYAAANLNPEEVAALKRVGAKITILPLVPGKSSSAILQRICSANE